MSTRPPFEKKRCPRCLRSKGLEAFYRCKARFDGHQRLCIQCQNSRDTTLEQKPVRGKPDPHVPLTNADFADARSAGMRLAIWGIR